MCGAILLLQCFVVSYVLQVTMQNIFAPWCNGSTEDFESFSLGSNPGGAAVNK